MTRFKPVPAQRITMVISSLQAGGAERVISTMANHWAGRGLQVTLINFSGPGVEPFYKLESNIREVRLGISSVSSGVLDALRNNLARIVVLRSAIRNSRPDVVISFTDKTNVLVLLATVAMKVPVIVSERSDPAMCLISPAWQFLRKLVYRRARAIVVQSKKAATYFHGGLQKRLRVIPNPVTVAMTEYGIAAERPFVVSMGRFTEEKRFDDIIIAFAEASRGRSNWRLMLVGDGPLRSRMESLAASLGIADRVSFRGTVRNPHGLISQADIFVLASRFEGFPCALCEAMACGVAAIATRYHEGVKDIIADGNNGVLVPPMDTGALAEAMARLMDDPVLRESLGSQAREIANRYSVERVMDMWDETISDVQLCGA